MNKMNMTQYIIDVTREVETLFTDLQDQINKISDKKSAMKTMLSFKRLEGMIAGMTWVINNIEDGAYSEVFQDMVESWEDRINCTAETVRVLTRRFVDDAQ